MVPRRDVKVKGLINFMRLVPQGLSIPLFLALLMGTNSLSISSANIFSNDVEANPKASQNIEIMLIDLSRSVDKDVVIEGLKSVRSKISNVYGESQGKYNSSANSYYFWLPISGQNDKKDFYNIFNVTDDKNVWNIVRNTVGGRENQVNILEKVRTDGGLWSKLILAGSLKNCTRDVSYILKTPGLFGYSLNNLSRGLCEQAIKSRNNIYFLNKTAKDYLSGAKSNNGGSDILGAIERIDDEMSSSLRGYKKVKLVFVSDGVNNTPSYALRKLLLEPGVDACSLGRMAAKTKNSYSASKVSVKMYGLGEGREKDNDAGSDSLRPTLREYWTCFWNAKGSIKPEFGQLNELGRG
jgi:hypothetical protein